ncbi:MAG TPA: superoxide dismutase [Fe] [Thermodesulforhabdus norvegica]|uniref:Superoxide dismutase n=1 Tax=Thermodesulforhabdus norvegica TaxID=39841 RepID=A0A7C1ATN1_9BACT|nr:superoxide dismutase [Fe] [Thermodesulforhabdus norvegica]
MTHELPALPYAGNALEPYISAETLEFHHGKHHATYVTKLNGLIPGTEFENATLEEIITKSAAGPIFNNAAQIWNHSFYWNCLGPNSGGEPTGPLADAINAAFGSFDAFKAEMTDKSVNLFGSGWSWLVKDNAGNLSIVQTSNAGCPLTDGLTPLLTCDVWEHAYYIDCRNARPKYMENFWNLLNWDFVASNLQG